MVAANSQWLVPTICCTCNGNNPTEGPTQPNKDSPQPTNLSRASSYLFLSSTSADSDSNQLNYTKYVRFPGDQPYFATTPICKKKKLRTKQEKNVAFYMLFCSCELVIAFKIFSDRWKREPLKT
jgi:hypothetical protein